MKNKIIGFMLIIVAAVLLVINAVGLTNPQWLFYTLAALVVLAGCFMMWKEGAKNYKAKFGKETFSQRFLKMRQSGFFDVAVFFTVIAFILLIASGIGSLLYNSKLTAYMGNATDYNFKQSLGLLSSNYSVFLSIGLVILGIAAVSYLYMYFVSPIVRSDLSLQKLHKGIRVTTQYVLAIAVTLIFLFPIYWMLVSSFKTSDELLLTVPTLFPKTIYWQNYPNVLNRAKFPLYAYNTLVSTFFIMLGQVILGVLASYGFSKGQFKGKNILFLFVLGALMVPIQVTFIPIYVMVSKANWINTFPGLIVPNLVSAYFIFMLRQTFMSVDDSYLEAGRIDGMGRIGSIFNVLIPMSLPTVITVSIISFIDGWNSYFWPKMVAPLETRRTIAVGVVRLRQTFAGMETANYNEIMAGAVMAIIPIVVLFLVLQKYIMTGMSKAAMK